MIGTIDVTVQAARPDLPLPPVRAFVGSPSSVRVRNVPRRIGEWDITRVFVTANYPDSTTETAECVLTGGVWVGTVLGSATPGTSLSGFVVTADGVDEHGSAVSGYILGVGDVIVLTREESVTPGTVTFKGDKGDKGDPGEKGEKGDPGTGAVLSVNGKVGDVVLGANDVGAYSKGETDATVTRIDADVANALGAGTQALLDAAAAMYAANDAQSAANEAQSAASRAQEAADGAIADIASLPTVAHTGSYNDLADKPSFATVAYTGYYSDLSGTPEIPTEAWQVNALPNGTTATDIGGLAADGTAADSEKLGGVEASQYALASSVDNKLDKTAGGTVSGAVIFSATPQFTNGMYLKSGDFTLHSGTIKRYGYAGKFTLPARSTNATFAMTDQLDEKADIQRIRAAFDSLDPETSTIADIINALKGI